MTGLLDICNGGGISTRGAAGKHQAAAAGGCYSEMYFFPLLI